MELTGKNLKLLRKKSRITLTGFSHKTEISRTTLWRFENGGDMMVSNVMKYIDCLGLEIKLFLKE